MEYSTIYHELQARGLIAQITHETEIPQRLAEEGPLTVYAGFDPTAESLHVGHLLPIVLLARFQRYGHRVIAVAGGGTALIGDPSGKTAMRRYQDRTTIAANLERIEVQLKQFLTLDGKTGFLMNNYDWIGSLSYIDFLRDIGRYFSVNKMLSAECFKQRLEKGLSFIEFNYMLLQSYDFLHLYQNHGCTLQIGGDDQWSNILAGLDLIRRVEGREVYGLTAPLLLTHDGRKMGKTEKGAVWLDPAKTSPYDFYQYFRNVDDADTVMIMKYLSFVPMTDIDRYAELTGADINTAKERLAYDMTALVHGQAEADKAQTAARSLFSGGDSGGSIPTLSVGSAELQEGINVCDLFVRAGLCDSKSDARRQIKGNALSVNGNKISDAAAAVSTDDLDGERIELKRGKKRFCHLCITE